MAKTQGLVLRHPYQVFPLFTTISWQNDVDIEILGLLFFTDYLRTRNANWLVLLDTIRQDLTCFKARKLSLLGKILVKLCYSCQGMVQGICLATFSPGSKGIGNFTL